MKTTLEIDEGVMRALKAKAAREGKTMSELVDGALRKMLEERPLPLRDLPPLPTWNSGGLLVNIDRRAEWYDELEEGDDDVRR